MKNICFVLAFLTVLTALPSYAVKIIVNNENDRIVYSRSSFAADDTNYDVDEPEVTKKIVKTSYFKRAGLNPEADQHLLYLLGKDFRTELAGTQWNYEDEQVVTEVQEIETVVKSEYQEQLERLKRGSREAADYYMIDMTKNPNNLVPSGYLE